MIPALAVFLAFLTDLAAPTSSSPVPAGPGSRWRFVNPDDPYPARPVDHVFDALDRDPFAGLATLPDGHALSDEETDLAFVTFSRWNLLLIAPLWRASLGGAGFDDDTLAAQGDALIHFLEAGWEEPKKLATWCLTAIHLATELDRAIHHHCRTWGSYRQGSSALRAVRDLMQTGRHRVNAVDIAETAQGLIVEFVAKQEGAAKSDEVKAAIREEQMRVLEHILDRTLIGESAEVDWRPAMMIPEDFYAFG